MIKRFKSVIVAAILFLFTLGLSGSILLGDGKVVLPRDYRGSLEEVAQEAIIIFLQDDSGESSSIEHLILKIRVEGDADNFGWVIPFPNEPDVKKEDAELFKDCFDYVQARNRDTRKSGSVKSADANAAAKPAVDVLSRKIVGDFDIAVVRETEEDSLNGWLKQEGFQPLADAEDVLDFYRKKSYVYACIKVSSEALASEKTIESHPLRFTFETGGRDGIFFPMKLTGLQEKPFDVNLYVFYRAWLNRNLNKFGYENRGFKLTWRDFDSPSCESNAGKNFSNPDSDPYLKNHQRQLKSVTRLMQKLAPGERFYLTNIQARNLKPDDVRDWSDDLWLFPHYTDRSHVPYDVVHGPANAAWPNETQTRGSASLSETVPRTLPRIAIKRYATLSAILISVGLIGALAFAFLWTRKKAATQNIKKSPEKPNKPIEF